MKRLILAALAAGTLTLGALAQTDPNAPTQPTTPTTPTSPTTPTTPTDPNTPTTPTSPTTPATPNAPATPSTPAVPVTPSVQTAPSVSTAPLEEQIETVGKLIRLTEQGANNRSNRSVADYPYLFTQQQVEALLPYLREVQALSALTEADVAFYSGKIEEIITDAQRAEAAKLQDDSALDETSSAVNSSGNTGTTEERGNSENSNDAQTPNSSNDARDANDTPGATQPSSAEAGGSNPSVTGGGVGVGGSSSGAAGITAVAPSPFLEAGDTSEQLNRIVTVLTLWQSNFDDDNSNGTNP